MISKIKKIEKILETELNEVSSKDFNSVNLFDYDLLSNCFYVVDKKGFVEGLSLPNYALVENGGTEEDVLNIICELKTLKFLNLKANFISNIKALKSLINLEILILEENDIFDVEPLNSLINLTSLDLSSNTISNINALKSLKNLEFLNLNSNHINDIEVLGTLTNLTDLFLADNDISNIESLSPLKNLKNLDLGENRFFNLNVLNSLINLRILDLSRNGISDIKNLSSLKNLTTLYLSDNKLTNIDILSSLKNLEFINLNFNQISDIEALGTLKKLKQLYLRSNYISDIEVLSKLVNLKHLHLGNNEIKKIGISILKLGLNFELQSLLSIGDINLSENPIESPPTEIIHQGKEAMLAWFKASKKKLNEIKVILIGEAEAGKTSLLRRLKYNEYVEKEIQTDGINIEDIKFNSNEFFTKQEKLHNVTGHFWDFGGQETMSSTHQFFLTKRTVYILLLKARTDNDISGQIKSWIKKIRATGGNSSIIVAVNKIDDHTGFGFENEYEIKKEFPQVKGFIKISCKENTNIDILRDKLEELIPQAELFDTEIDERWIEIKDKLIEETKKKEHLNELDFNKICREFKLTEKDKQKNAINFFHDLGVVLHFENINLKEYFVLDPYWITYGVYQILTSKFVGTKNGIININDLEYIINEEEEKEKQYKVKEYRKIEYTTFQRKFLIDILTEFKLAFYKNPNESIIIPDLLITREPIEKTKSIRECNDCISLVYDYSYLPKSTIPNILVETHELHEEIWRTGCILKLNNSHALISSYDNQISITVVGKEKSDFLTVIQYIIDKINLGRNKPRKLVPLPETNVYEDLDILLEMKEDGEKYYKLYKPVKKKYEISILLEGVAQSNNENLEKKVDRILNEVIKNSLEQHEYLTGFETLNSKINEIMKVINGEMEQILDNEKHDFLTLLSAVLNYHGRVLHEGKYKKVDKITEDDFRDDVINELRRDRSIGELLKKEPQVNGGRVEIDFKGIPVELKVERTLKTRSKIIEKYLSQPVCYSSGNCKQFGILIILDLVEKDNPSADPRNNITLETPKLHGFENDKAKYPTKICTIIIDGNTKNPSDYSK